MIRPGAPKYDVTIAREPLLGARARAASLAYIAVIVLWNSVSSAVAVATGVASRSVSEAAGPMLLLLYGPQLLCTVALAVLLLRRSNRQTVHQLIGRIGARTLIVALASLAASYLLAASTLWLWEWQRPGNSLPTLMMEWSHSGQLWAMLVHLVSAALVIPCLEELIFRGVLLQGLRARSNSDWVAVATSAAIFGVLHLGPLNNPAEWRLSGAFWAFLLGIAAAVAVLKDAGRLRNGIAIHAARNGLESVFLIVGAIRATSA